MTSEIDVLKTNEFLRRRKLRLQQVREQSKDIAKKIRQKAKVEKLRQTISLDAKKEKEYYDLQEKFVGQLEKLYSQSLQNVGSSHKNASEALVKEKPNYQDISKLRGKEAVTEVRKRKQEKLDEQKKILDRKLQARETANELSREKFATVVKTLNSKSVENIEKTSESTVNQKKPLDKESGGLPRNDMATQWEIEELPDELGLNIPMMSLPKEDKNSFKNSDNDKSENIKLNLFALSDEMPSSLRGGLSNMPSHATQQRSSVTLVSEYLHTRNLRLRESEPISAKGSDDLQSIKQTILRSRTSKINVSAKSDKTKGTAEPSCNRPNPVTMYNHSTRHAQQSYKSDALVLREQQKEDDAYTKALKETCTLNQEENCALERKKGAMRSKVAVAREKVDKEYKDTLAFLNSLAKDKSSESHNASHLDYERQQMQNDRRQKKMQEEFKRIEKDSSSRTCKHRNRASWRNNRSESGSPEQSGQPPRGFQYDWMPVPEEDANLVVHSIPNRNEKNNVKFNDVDTYHEYRCRHKHTPPTKEAPDKKRLAETLLVEADSSASSDASRTSLSASAEEGKASEPRLSDGDRIVIYKVLEAKRDRKRRGTRKSKGGSAAPESEVQDNSVNTQTHSGVREGVYRVEDVGDNIASAYFPASINPGKITTEQRSTRDKSVNHNNGPEVQRPLKSSSLLYRCTGCKCSHSKQEDTASAGTSTCSFLTASKGRGAPSDAAFVQLVGDGGQEAGNFYIGASGFLKDDNYEVVIQLKKKETERVDLKTPEGNAAEEGESKKVDMEVQSCVANRKESAAQTSMAPEADGEAREREADAPETAASEPDTIAPSKTELSRTDDCIMGVDKDVNTSCQDSYAIADNVTKSEPAARPAASAYTQTSFSSPNLRPVFMHMTSSTSTAYMSPPDFVLPPSLREARVAHPLDAGQCCRRRHKAKRRYCRHICSTTDTPPNTAHSDDFDGSLVKSTGSETPKHQHRGKLCRRKLKAKSNATLLRGPSKVTTSPQSSKSRNKQSINPVLKTYVNKLLALNREGLRAVQVIEQDCSAVDTPSSSVMNASSNKAARDTALDNKISLEQIKIMLEKQIVSEYAQRGPGPSPRERPRAARLAAPPRRRQVHKVKLLNISRHLFRNSLSSNSANLQPNGMNTSNHGESWCSAPPHDRDTADALFREESRSKSSPTRRAEGTWRGQERLPSRRRSSSRSRSEECYALRHKRHLDSTDSDKRDAARAASLSQVPPTDISTQTSGIDSEIHIMKLAENKLQNMEKIADLTEKCTKRLSNLAKVLEEVRRNKSLVYSHISTSDTASEPELKGISRAAEQACRNGEAQQKNATVFGDVLCQDKLERDFTPLLSDIPKPLTPSTLSLSTISERSNVPSSGSVELTKQKAKPPPSMSRIHLKASADNFGVPHELSTVMEVDSPMSIQLKHQSTRRDLSHELSRVEPYGHSAAKQLRNDEESALRLHAEIHINKDNPTKARAETPTTTSDDTKMEMMDMKLFNDIMLQPFVSLQEYAKQCNAPAEEPSRGEGLASGEQGDGDNIASLHSDASLPDVISELLKRKLINEPFKFDTASRVTSSISSESSLSLWALSNMYKAKRKSKHVANKENMAETSETLSISSNPDLETAFKQLGMGWASSTLKKTKERLALSSSSNTSSSSYSHLKLKSFNREPPPLGTDSSLSELNDSAKKPLNRSTSDNAKHAIQQTSLTNSMTVKEFLTNELAKKITFTNKSDRHTDEFISLYETKMPDELRNAAERSVDGEHSVASQANNRARTSTPVQLFRSTTYHTTSGSNTSNGLFSNVEELSSVKATSTSAPNHSAADKDDLTVPNCSLKRKGSDDSKSA